MANLDWRLECDACQGGTEPNEDLHVSVSLDRSRFVRDEAVRITITVLGRGRSRAAARVSAGSASSMPVEPVAIELID